MFNLDQKILYDMAIKFDVDNFGGELIKMPGKIHVFIEKMNDVWTIWLNGHWLLPDGSIKTYHQCIDWNADYHYDWAVHKGSIEDVYLFYVNWKKKLLNGDIVNV